MSSLNRTFMVRLSKETQMLQTSLPPEITCWPEDENQLDKFRAVMKGPPDSPYSGGIFTLSLSLPTRYPHEPPKVNFLTRIYHPNIDQNGRICHNILKIPPTGTWKPGFNLITVLMAIYSLMSDPNPDDPLDADVATQFKNDRILFNQTAELLTKKHATGQDSSEGKSAESSSERSGDSGGFAEENSQELTKSVKTKESKASARPQPGKKSFSLRKASTKEKSVPILVDSKTSEKKGLDKLLAQPKIAASESLLPKKPLESKDLEKDVAEDPPQPEDLPNNSSIKAIPILGSTPSTSPEKKPIKSLDISTGKKKGKKSVTSVPKTEVLETPKVTTKPSVVNNLKKRTIEETESSKSLIQQAKKRTQSKKSPQKPRGEQSSKEIVVQEKESAFGEESMSKDGCEIELDLTPKTNGLVAKVTLAQTEDTPTSKKIKSRSMTPKTNTSVARVPQDHVQPLASTSEKITKEDSPLVIKKSSYFSSSCPRDASPILESESPVELPPIKPKACTPTRNIITPEIPSLECEKLPRTDSLDSQGERKRGWRPSPLRESVSAAKIVKSKEPRRPTFSLKKLKKSDP